MFVSHMKIVLNGGWFFFKALIMKYATSDFIKEYNRTVFETYSANIEFGEKQTEIIFWDVSGDDLFER